jgi:serine/threonine protein kinase
VAPEIIKLTHSEHVEPVCDVFSLGAVFHILLSRQTLFAGTKFDEVCTNNKEFRMDLDGEHLNDVSSNAKELMKKMLVLDPSRRITAG